MPLIHHFSAHSYDRETFTAAASQRFPDDGFRFEFDSVVLDAHSAKLAEGADAVCVFVNDDVSAPVLEQLAALGVRAVLLRCAGFNNVDLEAAERLGISVARVPAYSPEAVAEHAIALYLALNRRIHRAYNRVREGNFALHGLMGRTVHGKTVGVIGTGRIGAAAARIFHGFGTEVLVHDPVHNPALDGIAERVELRELLFRSDIVSLHCPLTPETHHLIDADRLAIMKPDAVLVNTSRGPLIDTAAVIQALKRHRLGGLAIDVYEQEGDLFFSDRSSEIIDDDVFVRLSGFPNVIVTGHQAFFTEEAVDEIVDTTLQNWIDIAAGGTVPNAVRPG